MNAKFQGDFDFVIVGAGSAGCVLANRLSASPAYSVLALEAGTSANHWLINIPAGVAKVWNSTRFNWNYVSEPEPFMLNRRIEHPRGKVIGGCSSVNMGAHVRGSRNDYDRWGAMGLADWTYEKVLPYFKKSETFLSDQNEYRGTDGPLKVSVTPVQDPVFDAYLSAGKAHGLEHIVDYNAESQIGLSKGQFTVAEGRRQSSFVAFLKPVIARRNLSIRLRTLVTRILFEGNRAIGVEYINDGQLSWVRARKEVILSAGAYNSPQLLMLSGIGPEEELRRHGIKVIAARQQVGANLQDHPTTAVEYERRTYSEFHRNLRIDRLTLNMLQALLFRHGPASHPLGFATGFISAGNDEITPEFQIFLRLFSKNAHPWFWIIKPPGPNAIGLMACHLHPESRGNVSLRSGNPGDAPRIVNNFFSTENDKASIRSAFKLIRSLASSAEMTNHLGLELLPGTDCNTDDEIDDYIRSSAATLFHPAGTCRMGIDRDSVVDAELKVRDCDGLRVVDASVMPDLVSGNINAAVLMIAEKASDYIRQSHSSIHQRVAKQ